MNYGLLFVVFGFVGWSIDTAYRSVLAKKYAHGTYIPFFAVSYGIGGSALVVLFQNLQAPAIVHIILGTILVTLIEFVAGIFCVAVLKRRLWDYSKNKLNFMGHIDALHAIYWLLLTALFWLVFPYFLS